ncbi:hypothetical protein A6J53_02285 [Neisseria meningitidis]|nr:hypothetical protein A6J53_02285 [Neisseria meningitidis]
MHIGFHTKTGRSLFFQTGTFIVSDMKSPNPSAVGVKPKRIGKLGLLKFLNYEKEYSNEKISDCSDFGSSACCSDG